jgi:hypothetical protein
MMQDPFGITAGNDSSIVGWRDFGQRCEPGTIPAGRVTAKLSCQAVPKCAPVKMTA